MNRTYGMGAKYAVFIFCCTNCLDFRDPLPISSLRARRGKLGAVYCKMQ